MGARADPGEAGVQVPGPEAGELEGGERDAGGSADRVPVHGGASFEAADDATGRGFAERHTTGV